MNSQELRQQVKALEDSVQSMDSWIKVKQSVLDAYAWKIDDLRNQLRKRKWSRGSAPALKEELHLAQVRYSHLEESVLAEQVALDEQKRILAEYSRSKTLPPERSQDYGSEVFTNPKSDPDDSDPTDSELFFQEIDAELQAQGLPLSKLDALQQLPLISKPTIADLPSSSVAQIPILEISRETSSPDPFHLEASQTSQTVWPQQLEPNPELKLPDTKLAQLSSFSSHFDESVDRLDEFQSHEGFSAQPERFEQWATSSSSHPVSSLNRSASAAGQIQLTQQAISKLETEIQKMSSWIAQQQEELASYDWTAQNLRDRLNVNPLSLSSMQSIRQELDYALEQSQSLNQSIQSQRQKCAKSQQQLDRYYQVVARLQKIPTLEAAISKLKTWVEQQQEELDALNWTIADLRDRLKRDEQNPRTTLGIHQELDYALDQYTALEHSVYLQRQKLAEQQVLLNESYAELNRP